MRGWFALKSHERPENPSSHMTALCETPHPRCGIQGKPVQALEWDNLAVILVFVPGIDHVTLGSSLPSLELKFPICEIKKLNSLDDLWGPLIANTVLFLPMGLRGGAGALTKWRKVPKIQKCYFVRTCQVSSQSNRTGSLCREISLWKWTQRPNRRAESRGKQLFPFTFHKYKGHAAALWCALVLCKMSSTWPWGFAHPA